MTHEQLDDETIGFYNADGVKVAEFDLYCRVIDFFKPIQPSMLNEINYTIHILIPPPPRD